MVFHQKSGVGMGGIASMDIAILTLMAMEWKWTCSVDNDTKRILMGSVICRYVDDAIAINYADFRMRIKEIYKDMEITETKMENNEIVFLDMLLNTNGKIRTYDKRDNMNVKVIKYTHATSNIPKIINKNTIITQCTRFRKINSEIKHMKRDVKNLLQEFRKNGFTKDWIIKCLLLFYEKDKKNLIKYGINERHEFIKSFLQIISKI